MRGTLQDCMVGLLFAFMPVLANNRSGGDVNHFDVMHTLFRRAGCCVHMLFMLALSRAAWSSC
jgi:hypothetical protein